MSPTDFCTFFVLSRFLVLDYFLSDEEGCSDNHFVFFTHRFILIIYRYVQKKIAIVKIGLWWLS